MSLTEADLNQMSTGAMVKDQDGDTWTKGVTGYWSINGAGSTYQERDAHYVVNVEGPITYADARAEESSADYRSEPYSLSENPVDRTTLRMEVLQAENAWLGEGYDDDLFTKGVERGWFTDKFFTDLAEGDAF